MEQRENPGIYLYLSYSQIVKWYQTAGKPYAKIQVNNQFREIK